MVVVAGQTHSLTGANGVVKNETGPCEILPKKSLTIGLDRPRASEFHFGKRASYGVYPSPDPSESRDWRGVCKNVLQNLEAEGLRAQNLENMRVTALFVEAGCAASASTMICFLDSWVRVGCHSGLWKEMRRRHLRNWRRQPKRTQFVTPSCFPGTSVPGYHIPPFRGWGLVCSVAQLQHRVGSSLKDPALSARSGQALSQRTRTRTGHPEPARTTSSLDASKSRPLLPSFAIAAASATLLSAQEESKNAIAQIFAFNFCSACVS